MSVDPILPPGIKIGAGTDENEQPAVRIDLRANAGTATIDATLGFSPRQARAFAALLLRQADLIEGRAGVAWGLRLVGEGR